MLAGAGKEGVRSADCIAISFHLPERHLTTAIDLSLGYSETLQPSSSLIWTTRVLSLGKFALPALNPILEDRRLRERTDWAKSGRVGLKLMLHRCLVGFELKAVLGENMEASVELSGILPFVSHERIVLLRMSLNDFRRFTGYSDQQYDDAIVAHRSTMRANPSHDPALEQNKPVSFHLVPQFLSLEIGLQFKDENSIKKTFDLDHGGGFTVFRKAIEHEPVNLVSTAGFLAPVHPGAGNFPFDWDITAQAMDCYIDQDPNYNEASETVAGDKDRMDDDTSGLDLAEDHKIMKDFMTVLGPYLDASDEHKETKEKKERNGKKDKKRDREDEEDAPLPISKREDIHEEDKSPPDPKRVKSHDNHEKEASASPYPLLAMTHSQASSGLGQRILWELTRHVFEMSVFDRHNRTGPMDRKYRPSLTLTRRHGLATKLSPVETQVSLFAIPLHLGLFSGTVDRLCGLATERFRT
ncbi:hypothetical protein LA080_001429 [Diaporthe eres]|nr:hypothetical protein LA080_001429 [Diaporthe eres]